MSTDITELSEDICDLPEFKDDPVCKKQTGCSITENLFWMAVLIAVAFFLTCWNNLITMMLDKVFGPHKSELHTWLLAIVSLIIVLIIGCYFGVDLSY